MDKQTAQELRTCANCLYYIEHAASFGDCHRYPPTFAGADTPNERHRWKHPLVPRNNWCGEFQLRQDSAATGRRNSVPTGKDCAEV